MSATAIRPVAQPATPARILLARAVREADTSAPSILDRILTPGQRASVEVAAFQSSV